MFIAKFIDYLCAGSSFISKHTFYTCQFNKLIYYFIRKTIREIIEIKFNL